MMRMPSIPEVAAVAAQGYRGYEDYTRRAFFAPTGTMIVTCASTLASGWFRELRQICRLDRPYEFDGEV
jgi:hypothetical protein